MQVHATKASKAAKRKLSDMQDKDDTSDDGDVAVAVSQPIQRRRVDPEPRSSTQPPSSGKKRA